MRTPLSIILLWSGMLGAAHAAEMGPVATAPADDQPPISTEAQIERFLSHADEAPPQPVRERRKIHGEVGAAIGSGGYRSAYGMVDIPFGENNNLGLAAQTTRLPSRGGRGGGSVQSLAISLNIQGPLTAAGECMRRTGTRLLSDAETEAECARKAAERTEARR